MKLLMTWLILFACGWAPIILMALHTAIPALILAIVFVSIVAALAVKWGCTDA